MPARALGSATIAFGLVSDEVRAQVMALIQRKVEGEDISIAPTEQPERKIVDLMEALKASLSESDKRRPAKRTDAGKAAAKGTAAKSETKATSRKAPRKKRAG